jgi:surfeit locus 1 family protein
LDRLGERRSRNAEILQQQSLPDLLPSQISLDADVMVYRRITLTGVLHLDQAVKLKNRSYEGQPGEHLLAPLEISDQLPWLMVDLGWIPISFPSSEAEPQELLPTEVTLSGIFLPSQAEPSWGFLADPTRSPEDPPLEGWRVLNIQRLEQELGITLLPFYLGAETAANLEMNAPIPDTILDLTSGPHLGYAIQWFSFALIALVGGTYWIQRQRKTKEG